MSMARARSRRMHVRRSSREHVCTQCVPGTSKRFDLHVNDGGTGSADLMQLVPMSRGSRFKWTLASLLRGPALEYDPHGNIHVAQPHRR